MTGTVSANTGSTDPDQKIYKRHNQAIANLSKMLPQLTAYARNLTGDKNVRVHVGPELSCTDGKNIYIRPPLALAGKRKHDSGKCETYDEIGRSNCRWCATREFIQTTLQHEIGHILGGSFKELDRFDVNDLITAAQASGFPAGMYSKMHSIWESNNDLGVLSLMSALNYPQMQYLSLMTEDIRCNEGVFQRSPVQLERFRTRDREFLEYGVQDKTGTYTKYIEMNPDTQLVVASYMQAFEHELIPGEHFSEEVMEVINLKSVQSLTNLIRYSTDVTETASLTFKLAGVYRSRGFFKEPDQLERELSSEELEEFLEELKKFIELMMGHGIKMLGHSCEDGDAHTGMGAGGGTIEMGGLDGGDPEAGDGEKMDSWTHMKQETNLSKVINSMWVLDRTPVNVGAPEIFRPGEGEAYESYRYDHDSLSDSEKKIPESVLGKSVSRARLLFEENSRVHRHRNQKSGRITSRVLAKRVPFNDPRVFETKIKPDDRDYAVVIGIDISGSTGGMNIKLAKQAAAGQAEVCARTGVSFAIYAHSTSYGPDGMGGVAPAIWHVKDFSEPWSTKQKENLFGLRSVAGNLDGHSMQYYRKQLDKARATDKILLYYTDGKMPASNYDEELRVLKSEIQTCKRKGYTLLGVGIRTDSPKSHGLDTVQVDSTADMLKVVEHLGKRLRGGK